MRTPQTMRFNDFMIEFQINGGAEGEETIMMAAV